MTSTAAPTTPDSDAGQKPRYIDASRKDTDDEKSDKKEGNSDKKKGGQISGVVVDASNQAPLSGISVNIYDRTGRLVADDISNATGHYTSKPRLPAGSYYAVTSNSRGYVNQTYNEMTCLACSPTSGTPIPITLGATTNGIDFELAPGGRIAGTIRDASSSEPLSGIRVTVYAADGTRVASGSTNATGRYVTATGLPSGTYYATTSARDGYVRQMYQHMECMSECTSAVTTSTGIPVVLGITTDPIDFSLFAGGRVAGAVTDAVTAAPLANVAIGVMTADGARVASAFTNKSGHYSTREGLLSGAYFVYTENAAGHISEIYNGVDCLVAPCAVTAGATPVDVTRGVTTMGVDFGLQPGARVSGTVRDALSGAPLSGVEVRLYDHVGQPAGYGYSDSDGDYTSQQGLPDGTYYARTNPYAGYALQQYAGRVCARGTCAATSGTPIAISGGDAATDVDFALPECTAVIALSPAVLPSASRGIAYAQRLIAGGGTSPYGFLLDRDVTLPPGVSLSSSGILSGTPTTLGSFSLAAWAIDAHGCVSRQAFRLRVTEPFTLTLSADHVAPQPPGTTVTFTATASGGMAPHEFKWWVYDGVTWTVTQGWSPTATFPWNPAMQNGRHQVSVWARTAGNTADVPEQSASMRFPILTRFLTGLALTADPAAPQHPGTTVTFTATPAGGSAEFKWWLYDGVAWTVTQGWSPTATFTWTPAMQNARHQLTVWARTAGNTADVPEQSASMRFPILTTFLTSLVLTADRAAPQSPGTTVTFTAAATGGSAEFKWWLYDGVAWTVTQGWSPTATFTWTPAMQNAGHQLTVWARAAGNTADVPEQSANIRFPILTTFLTSLALTADRAAPQHPGTTVTFTAAATGGSAEFKWWLYDGVAWTVTQGWSATGTWTWTPATPSGAYQVTVWARTAGNTADVPEQSASRVFAILNNP